MTEQEEKWPGQNNGLPEPDTDEWKAYHKKIWEERQPISESGLETESQAPLEDLVETEES